MNRYRIVLRGAVSDRMLARYLDHFDITRADNKTTLTGPITDAADLNRVITDLTSSGLNVFELNSVTDLPDPP